MSSNVSSLASTPGGVASSGEKPQRDVPERSFTGTLQNSVCNLHRVGYEKTTPSPARCCCRIKSANGQTSATAGGYDGHARQDADRREAHDYMSALQRLAREKRRTMQTVQRHRTHTPTVGITSTTPQTAARQRACSARCVSDRDARGSPASCAGRRRCWRGSSRTSAAACAGARSCRPALSPATRIR